MQLLVLHDQAATLERARAELAALAEEFPDANFAALVPHAGGAEILFNIMKGDFASAVSDWDDGAVVWRLLLLSAATEGTTNNPDRQFVSDIVGANGGTENTGTGYTRKDVTSRAVTVNNTNDRAELSGSISAWTGANFGTTVAGAIYKRVGADDSTPADDRLASYYTTNFPKTTNGGDLTATPNAAGLITLT